MNTLRMNITLPIELGKKLKSMGNASGFIARVLQERFASQEKERRQKELAAAYRAVSHEERAMVDDWDALASEGL